jgi:NAD(P)-dependent dehydrogenase (short-subunit alcohol dehydrogenase family)
VFTDLAADGVERMSVALVAGATRGAGRAIAAELARLAGRAADAAHGRAYPFDHLPGVHPGDAADRRFAWHDLVKANVERIVKQLAAELENLPVTAVGVTPGWLRSEMMLETSLSG